MMKSISATVIAVSAMLLAGTASAGITPNGVYSLGGAASTDSNLNVSQSVSLTGCKINWPNSLTVSGGVGNAAVTGSTLSVGSLCSGVSLQNNWTVSAVGTNLVQIYGFKAKTLNGECGGTTASFNGSYDPVTGNVTINASVPGWYDVIPGIGPRIIKDCTINGYVKIAPGLVVTP